jgi:predicted P-loop ATPase
MELTIFRNFNEVVAQKSLKEITEIIRDGMFRKQVETLQQTLVEKGTEAYGKSKKELPAFTPSGKFEGGRKPAYLKEYSKLIILDIDKLKVEQVNELRVKINNCAYTHCSFLSPSGLGLKIMVKIRSKLENHKQAFNTVKFYYEGLLGVPIDPSGKDVTRLCFLSYDPDLYMNPDSKAFPVNKEKADHIQTFQKQVEFTNQKTTYYEGNRNNFIHALACNCNRSGIPESIAMGLIQQNYDLEETEIKASVSSAYKNAIEHGKKKQSTQKSDTKDEKKVTTNKFRLAKEYLEENFDIRNNIVSNEFEYRDKGKGEYKTMNENTIFIKMQLDGVNLGLNNLVALLKSELVAHYNPFWDYFINLPEWDQQTDYIVELSQFVKVQASDRERFDNHFKKWIVRMVKCALHDDFFNKQAFILVHDKQNSGKSTFCRFLCPPNLKNYIAENLSIDKDSRILLTTNMLINLDELSTLSKVEINSLKSLFSKDKINDRLPYDRKNSIIPRRASFIGSTNQTEFLNDESGSVRWLCFIIEEIDWNYKDEVNIDLVYSQAFHLLNSDFLYNLTPEEIKENEEINKQFQIVTAERELIQKYMEPGTEEDHSRFMTATDILVYIKEFAPLVNNLNKINIGKSLKFLGYKNVKPKKQRVYGYFVKFLESSLMN